MGILVLAVFIGICALFLSSFIAYKLGYKTLLFLVPLAAVFFIGGIVFSDNSLFLFSSFVVGAVTGLSFKYTKSVLFLLIAASVIISSVSLLSYSYSTIVKNNDPIGSYKVELFKMIDSAGKNPAETELMKNYYSSILIYAKRLMPSLLFLYALLSAAIGYFIIKPWIIKRLRTKPLPGLEFFKINEYLIFILIASLAATIFSVKKADSLFWFSSNALLIMGLLYIVQSLGILKYYAQRHGIPVIIIPLILTCLFFYGPVLGIVAILLAGIGALDIWVDFRKLSRKPDAPSDED